jgi:hypothetical protein
MPWGAAVGGALSAGGGILTGILGGNASAKAAQAQADAAQKALQFQQGVYSNAQTNLNPFIQSGNTSLTSLMGLLGLGGTGQNATANSAFQAFTQNPSYQFPLQQGNLALNRQLASSGLSGSGAALKDATQYNQGYASQGLNSYLSQLLGLSQQGQGAAGALAGYGNTAAGNVSNLETYTGNAQGNGILGQAAGINKAISGGIAGLTGNNYGGSGGPNSLIGQLTNSALTSMGSTSYGGTTSLPAAQNPDPSGIYPAGGLT